MSSYWSCHPETVKSEPIVEFSAPVTLQFDGWPREMIYLLYATSSFVHHYVAICEFKLVLQFGNAQFGSKSSICRPVWPWYLTHDIENQYGTFSKAFQGLWMFSYPSVNSNRSYSPERLNLDRNRRFFGPCNLEIWRMTSKNNRTPLLCHYKLSTSFRSHPCEFKLEL